MSILFRRDFFYWRGFFLGKIESFSIAFLVELMRTFFQLQNRNFDSSSSPSSENPFFSKIRVILEAARTTLARNFVVYYQSFSPTSAKFVWWF